MRWFVLLAMLAGACTTPPPPPVAHAPLVEPTPPPPDETPEIRRVLDAFLTARWAFDYDTAAQHVTQTDAAEPWHDPREDQFTKMRHAEYWTAHSWSIGAIQVDDETATVHIELIRPGMRDTMFFQMRTSLRLLKATSRWLRDRDKQDAELRTIMPPRQVKSLTYRLRKEDGEWRVFMDWPGARAIAEENNDDLRRELFEMFDGSEAELYQHQPPLDDRTRKLVTAVDEAERAVRDRDVVRARELYDALLMSDAAVPDFLAARRNALDELQKKQDAKLAEAALEVGSLRGIDGKYELRVKNEGRDLRSFRLVAEYVDAEGERTYRSIYERQLAGGESRTVLVHPSRGKKATNVRLVNVRFLDRELEQQFEHHTDTTFQMRLQDLRSNGAARSSAHRVASVMETHEKDFDECPWPNDAEPIDVWVEVEEPPRAKVTRALVETDSELGKCLARVAAELEYPDAAGNRSIVRVYPPTHWWRQN